MTLVVSALPDVVRQTSSGTTSSYFPPAVMLAGEGIQFDRFLAMRPVKAWQGQIDAVHDVLGEIGTGDAVPDELVVFNKVDRVGAARVATGLRPGGFSSRREMSRSP